MLTVHMELVLPMPLLQRSLQITLFVIVVGAVVLGWSAISRHSAMRSHLSILLAAPFDICTCVLLGLDKQRWPAHHTAAFAVTVTLVALSVACNVSRAVLLRMWRRANAVTPPLPRDRYASHESELGPDSLEQTLRSAPVRVPVL